MGKVDNVRIMRTAVGNANTVRFLADRVRGKHDQTRRVQIEGLTHPISLTGELSDLEMLAEARVSPIYRQLPGILGADMDGVMVDVGANIGTTSTLFASMFPHATLTSVEPFARNRAVLERNLLPYGPRVQVLERALTATGGTAYLVNPEAATNDEFCGLRFDGEANETGEVTDDATAVEALTPAELLDAVGNPATIALFKLDVEGGERELAAAGLVDILAKTTCFVVETHDRYRPGATDAVRAAATEAGLAFRLQHENDYFFVRPR